MIQQISCWMTSDRQTFLTQSEAEEHEEALEQVKILSGLESWRRDTDARDIAEDLRRSGYFIIKREVYDRMTKQLNNPRVHLLVSQLTDEGIL